MLVWQKIASHTSMKSLNDVANWLNKYSIKACDLENVVGYVGKCVCCNNDCNGCLYRYLNIDLDVGEFTEVIDELGNIQLKFK